MDNKATLLGMLLRYLHPGWSHTVTRVLVTITAVISSYRALVAQVSYKKLYKETTAITPLERQAN